VRAVDDVVFERHLAHRRGDITLGPPATHRLADPVDHEVNRAAKRGDLALPVDVSGLFVRPAFFARSPIVSSALHDPPLRTRPHELLARTGPIF